MKKIGGRERGRAGACVTSSKGEVYSLQDLRCALGRRSGVSMWVCSILPILGMIPSICAPYSINTRELIDLYSDSCTPPSGLFSHDPPTCWSRGPIRLRRHGPDANSHSKQHRVAPKTLHDPSVMNKISILTRVDCRARAKSPVILWYTGILSSYIIQYSKCIMP
jgi:hypothetical protein